jgi:hypothetical protein
MIQKEDFMIGMKRLNEVLNMADQVQPLIMQRCMEEAKSFEEMDAVQFMVLWNDLVKMLQPLNDKFLELQTVSMFRELQPKGNPEFSEQQ